MQTDKTGNSTTSLWAETTKRSARSFQLNLRWAPQIQLSIPRILPWTTFTKPCIRGWSCKGNEQTRCKMKMPRLALSTASGCPSTMVMCDMEWPNVLIRCICILVKEITYVQHKLIIYIYNRLHIERAKMRVHEIKTTIIPRLSVSKGPHKYLPSSGVAFKGEFLNKVIDKAHPIEKVCLQLRLCHSASPTFSQSKWTSSGVMRLIKLWTSAILGGLFNKAGRAHFISLLIVGLVIFRVFTSLD